MAYDVARGRCVLTAGYNPGNSGLATTWEYDGAGWVSFPVSLAGTRGQLQYDPAVQRVAFASAEWDGSAWSLVSAPTIYNNIHYSLLGIDPVRGERLATANGTDGRLLTSRFDGAAWHSVARRMPRFLGWDAVHQRMLGLGQIEGGGSTTVWQWDGRTMEPLAASQGFASLLAQSPPIHDTVRDVWMTFWPGPGGARSFYEVRPSDWTTIRTGILPLASTMAFCFDPVRNRVVLEGISGLQSQTWEYDGVAWVQRSPLHHPSYLLGMNMVFDPLRNLIVMYTGWPAGQGSYDTWTYDGVDWSPVATTGHPPLGSAILSSPPMTFDPQRGVVVRVGAGQTWEFDGVDWALVPGGSLPSLGFLCAYDPQRARHVALEGNGTALYEYGPAQRPRAAVLGTGCPSSVAVLELDADQPPMLGRDTALRLRGLPPEPGVFVWLIGFDDHVYGNLALPASLAPYGLAAACELRIAPAIVEVLGHAGSTAVVRFQLPNVPALAGVQFFTQALAIDPWLATSAPLGITNAIRFVAGS